MKISIKEATDRIKDTLYLADISIEADIDVKVLPNLDLAKLNPVKLLKKEGDVNNGNTTSTTK